MHNISNLNLSTNGTSLWHSQPATKVSGYLKFEARQGQPDLGGWAEFYFNKEDWNTNKQGHIYTDNGFVSELWKALLDREFKHYDDINYSEYGLQSNEYVHFDVGPNLMREVYLTINNLNEV